MDSSIKYKDGTMVLQTFIKSGLCQRAYVLQNETGRNMWQPKGGMNDSGRIQEITDGGF